MKKLAMALCALIITLTMLAPMAAADSGEQVTLTIVGSWTDFRAMDILSQKFTAAYPNCTIIYESLQNYNETVATRMEGDDPIDIFMTVNIQESSPLLPYALDLYSAEGLDLSGTYEGLVKNFEFRGSGNEAQLYAIPLGGEIRGMYVNVTLLKSLGLEVPTDRDQLIACCETLKQNGYIPLHGNPGMFPQLLLYPWICSIIANADDPEAAYAAVNACGEGLSEMFREPMELLYFLMSNYYYDYKTAQSESNLFVDTTNEAIARDFLNIVDVDGDFEKLDDIGRVAFMPATMSLGNEIAKMREDYHSEIEYVFIPSPVGVSGGYAYLSPAHGIAICKNSPNMEWAIKFMNFLFTPENNKLFAAEFNVIPNTTDTLSYIGTVFDVPADHIVEVGQVSFDYMFYDTITAPMVTIAKGNNAKYMLDDGSGNLSLYPFDYYMEQVEASFAAARETIGGSAD